MNGSGIKRYFQSTGRKCREISGAMLMELAVTFALSGVFMVLAAAVLTSGMRLFYRVESDARAGMVCNLILDKISGEIAAAAGHTVYYPEPEKDGDPERIMFENRDGNPVAIYADQAGDGAARQLVIKAGEEEWHFDRSVYMEFEIDRLSFTCPFPEKHSNVIRIDLKIKNRRTGSTYSTYRYTENDI